MFNWLILLKIFISLTYAGIIIVNSYLVWWYIFRVNRSIMCKHIKGDPMMLAYRINIITGSIDALYHCKKCGEIMHFPLSLNIKEKELYNKRCKQTKGFIKSIKC